MDLGMIVICASAIVTFILVIIGIILLFKYIPENMQMSDIKNPFAKTPKAKKVPIVETPRPVQQPVAKKSLKDAWNVISQEAKKELPKTEVTVTVAKPLQPMPVTATKTTRRKLTPDELAKRKISTKPGKISF